MITIPGLPNVRLALWVDGQQIIPQASGYVGQLQPGQFARITAVVKRTPGHTMVGLDVDGAKKMQVMKNYSKTPGIDIFSTNIQIKRAHLWPHCAHTEYPDNHFRLLDIAANGQVRLWEISLISEYGEFYLVAQWSYQTQVYQIAGIIIYSPLWDTKKPWPQLMRIIRPLLDPSQLPSLPTDSQPEKTHSLLTGKQGRVLWWNCAQGFGAIATHEGDALVHWREVSTTRPFVYLIPDELVTYEWLVEPRMTKGRPTNFRLEAVGVTTT